MKVIRRFFGWFEKGDSLPIPRRVFYATGFAAYFLGVAVGWLA